jgi:hypothetical protein
VNGRRVKCATNCILESIVTRTGKAMLALSALILIGSGGLAHAQPVQLAAKTTEGFNVRGDFGSRADLTPDSKKTLQFDATKGRWGVKLDLDQPVDRDMALEDVRAGAFFKLTPSLRVGGAVSLGDQQPRTLVRKAQPIQEAAPRVRLETAFKF